MGELATINEFIARSRTARSAAELHGLCDGITREMGFDYFALVQLDLSLEPGQRGLISVTSFPVSWVEQLATGDTVEDDPAYLASCRSLVGFRWSDMGKIIELKRRHKIVLSRSRRAGLVDGFTVPAHVPGESNGLATFAIGHSRGLPEARLSMAQLAGCFSYEAARRLRREGGQPANPVNLTPRQLDCILLIARGKTDWEISRILGLAEDTITEHVDSARERYGVARRSQLIVRALYDGHFSLTDALH